MAFFYKTFNIALVLMLMACVQQPEPNRRSSQGDNLEEQSGDGRVPSGADTEKPTPGGIDSVDDDSPLTVEILNFVDPYSGKLSPKLTLPKNFAGKLSIQGINLSTLAGNAVKVRFRFGLNKEPIELDGLISTAPGLTPQTNIQVLTMEMKTRPFEDLRLLYDLYDYNDYDFGCIDTNGDGICDNDDTKRKRPVVDNRNTELYCRGLTLGDMSNSPTEAANCSASDKGSACLYAYAKVMDKGLVRLANTPTPTTPVTPTKPQIDLSGFGYYEDTDQVLLKRCLPEVATGTGTYTYVDDRDLNFITTSNTQTSTAIFNYLAGYTGTASVLYFDDSSSAEYVYDGPFRAIQYAPNNSGIWQLPEHAIFGPYGLFRGSLSSADPELVMSLGTVSQKLEAVRTGTRSLLFPRYGKLELSAGTQYWGASDSGTPTSEKLLQTMNNNGETNYVDGCNLRASYRDPNTNETISSCNVTADIEIVVLDEDGNELNRNIISNDLKLQLVKPAAIDDDGSNLPDFLYDNFKTCDNSNACAADECCYSNRCWSKQYVSKCPEDNMTIGFKEVGETCSSDFQCSTLCCDLSSGSCQPHDSAADPPVLCQKPLGQRCIATEWCRQVSQTEYYIIKEGTDELGQVQCSRQGYNRIKFSECRNGQCILPVTPSIPPFDPNDPERCDGAIDPPSF